MPNVWGAEIRTRMDFRSKPTGMAARAAYRFRPQPNQRACPGVLYGGMIASIMDCHCIGTAIAGAYDREERPPGSLPMIMHVTASLNVSYLKSTPMDVELQRT